MKTPTLCAFAAAALLFSSSDALASRGKKSRAPTVLGFPIRRAETHSLQRRAPINQPTKNLVSFQPAVLRFQKLTW